VVRIDVENIDAIAGGFRQCGKFAQHILAQAAPWP
jgi:hypothetical protein